MFMPNGVPFINSGQEVFERQPMNTGLDARKNELYMLETDDPFYGKLALFDLYQFHYTNPRRWELPDMLDFIKPIRKKYIKQITNKEYFVPLFGHHHPSTFVALSYFKKGKATKQNTLIVVANTDTYNEHYLKVDIRHLREEANNHEMIGKLLFSTHEGPREFSQFIDYNTLDIHLGAGEVKIIEL
jgi:hypothetical protein